VVHEYLLNASVERFRLVERDGDCDAHPASENVIRWRAVARLVDVYRVAVGRHVLRMERSGASSDEGVDYR